MDEKSVSPNLSPASSQSIPLEERLGRIQAMNHELSDSLRRLSGFQRRLGTIKNSADAEEALDQMELLLDEVLEFVYARLYLKDEAGELRLRREMCPPELELDWSVVEWALANQELAVVPLDNASGVQSLLLLPLPAHGGAVGILVLWVDFDPAVFSQEQSTLLTMLARETAAMLDSLRFGERLEQARATLANVVESVPHGIISLAADGQVQLLNGTCEFMFGVRRDQALERHFREVMPAPVAAALQKLISEALGDEVELNVDIRGSEEIFGLTATPLRDTEGTLQGHVVVCRDLKLSREVVKLRELDAMKNDFLSLVSHELRTPLTSILAYTETLMMDGMVETEQERREYLQIIHDEGNRLCRLINDVLDLTKMEAGKLEYLYSACQINDVAQNAVTNSASLAEKGGIRLGIELVEDLPEIRADADRLLQVLLNLLSNAIKFTPEGGRVTVRTFASPPLEGQAAPTITFEVEDTGCGIAPENLNRVFSKFEQIESIDHHSIGTGLGMPICKQIIEEGHAGKIWIESEVGRGTHVFCRLPVS